MSTDPSPFHPVPPADECDRPDEPYEAADATGPDGAAPAGDITVAQLLAVSATLAAELGELSRGRDALAAVVAFAVDTVPGADHASLSQGDGDSFRTLAASDELAALVDRAQREAGTGPCMDAARDGRTVVAGDLGSDPRWPGFSPAAVALGVSSVLAIRVVLDDVRAGLNLYARGPHAFGPRAATVATLLAVQGGQAVAVAAAREQAGNLQVALASNREVGMAMGVLMSAHKLLPEQAFDLLRIASQNSNRKLRDIARDVVDTGTLDLPRHPVRRKPAG